MTREVRCILPVFAWSRRYSPCGDPWNAVWRQKKGAAEKGLKRLAGCIDRGLDCVADELPVIRGHVEVVRSVAETLDPTQGDCESRRARFNELHGTWQASPDPVRQQMAKVLLSFEQGLFSGGDVAGLPQDNLDLERWFRNPKAHERRIHGHRHAGVRIVLEGPSLIHALDLHQRHPEPLTATDLLPFRDATPHVSQLQSLQRRSLMRRARSTKKRPILLAELESRYQDSP